MATPERKTFWDPQAIGDSITGTVTSIEMHERAKWGYPVSDKPRAEQVVLQLGLDQHNLDGPTGVIEPVWTWPTVMHNEMVRAQPQVGDVIRITLTDTGTSKQYQKAYQVFRVENLTRPPEPFDWAHIGQTPTRPLQPLPAAPGAARAQLPEGGDDVPF